MKRQLQFHEELVLITTEKKILLEEGIFGLGTPEDRPQLHLESMKIHEAMLKYVI